jgi:pre-mRNA-processing factor 19
MQCGMSGKVATTPVLNTKTGIVYEKQLVEKFVAQNGADPVTNAATDLVDLVAVNAQGSFVTPSAADVGNASIPGLVSSMQKEWDALMLSQFETKKELHSTRQQLARALYENDAAFRVIARLIKERDELKQFVDGMETNGASNAKKRKIAGGNGASSSSSSSSSSGAMDVDESSSSSATPGVDFDTELTRIKSMATQIAGGVKNVIKGLKESVPAFAAVSGEERKYHSSAAKKAGITSVAVAASGANVATGGVDGNVIISDRATGSVVHTFKGHSKSVAAVAWSDSRSVVVSGAAKEVRFWSVASGDAASAALKLDGNVSDVAMHPSGDYVVVGASDSKFHLVSVVSGQVLSSFDAPRPVTAVAWHPFGQLLAIALDTNVVLVYDVAAREPVLTFDTFTDEGKAGKNTKVTDLSFSFNGKWLCAVNNAGFVVVWVLKKQEVAASWLIDSDNDKGGAKNTAHVAFDASCTYLFCSRNSALSVVRTKGWEVASQSTTAAKKNITGIAAPDNAQFIATSSLGRQLILHTEA